MYNGKPAISLALSSDSQLIAIVPKARMFDIDATFTGVPVYPYITYEELYNSEGLNADDEEQESEVTFRFHIWNTSSNSTIAGHINRIMQSIGYCRNYSNDMSEVLDTGVIIKHKIMSFSGTFTA